MSTTHQKHVKGGGGGEGCDATGCTDGHVRGVQRVLDQRTCKECVSHLVKRLIQPNFRGLRLNRRYAIGLQMQNDPSQGSFFEHC